MAIILFLLIPVSGIALLFVKDVNKTRKITLNILLILNTILFLLPLMLAYSNTPSRESMWNENTGGGAALWLYILIFPLTGIFQLVLFILKLVYASKS
ncbi:hypothetical protein [Fluviicola sp.]|uniref:hypothetical protein n=1 Tax=Fluviicola sp. TaxID=1917219 RepID=UPI0031E44218